MLDFYPRSAIVFIGGVVGLTGFAIQPRPGIVFVGRVVGPTIIAIEARPGINSRAHPRKSVKTD
jgi:hypothetical protein